MSEHFSQRPPSGGFLFSGAVPVGGIWRNGHVQTIGTAYVARQDTPVVWDRWRELTDDGDFCDFDYVSPKKAPDSGDLGALAMPNTVLVIFHGLEGSSASHYAQSMAVVAQRMGWHVVVPHFRGCSGEPNWMPRAYHSGDADTIGWMLARVRARFTRCRMLAVGVSLGGNALMRWAGLNGSAAASEVAAIASICSPLNLGSAGRAIDQGLNRHIYAKHFLGTMQRKAIEKHRRFPGLFDLDAALKATSLAAFDNVFTAPLHGYANVEDYWVRAAASTVMDDIRVPALAINAVNDPFVPVQELPNPHASHGWVTHARPAWGGHVGFLRAGHKGRHMNALSGELLRWLHEYKT